MRKLCPKCFNFVSVKKGENCPRCGHMFEAKKSKKDFSTSITPETKKEGISPNLEALYNEANQVEKEPTKIEVVEKKKEDKSDLYHQKNGRVKWVSKRVREGKVKPPKFVSEPRVGGVHINVDEFAYFGKIKSKYNPSKFVSKVNGKYEIEKLKWWEIYKWADRQLAKRRINKVVKKEAVKRPERVSFGILLLLTIFTGYMGVHNFYAGNIKRGIVQASCFGLAMGFVMFLNNIPFFEMYMQGLLCALPGLISIIMWASDILMLILRRFKYATSRLEYIKTLDLETRARLGKKYIYIV